VAKAAEGAVPALGTVSEAAARARIRDLEGEEHELGQLWAERTAVLVFLRHFG
jgi:hypothetical protein